MAGVKLALAILLATCFASTFAVIKDCTFDNIDGCTKPVTDLDGSLDTDAICMAKRRAKDCLHNLQPGCTDAEHGAEKYKIEEILRAFNQDLSSCPEAVNTGLMPAVMSMSNTNHVKTTMKTTRNYPWTTRYPVSEPHYPECSWSSYDYCVDPLNAMTGIQDEYEKCSIWANAKDCMMKVWAMCGEGDVKEKLKRTYDEYSRTMSHCEHPSTTRYPVSEPHWPDCTMDSYYHCVNPLYNMSADPYMDSYTKCKIWAKGKECLKQLDHCGDSGELGRQTEQTWNKFYSEMSYCNDYWTTHYPTSEPHHGWSTRYPTAEPEPGYKCTWLAIQKCSAAGNEIAGETDMKKICHMVHEMKKCFEWFADDCHDEQMINTVRQTITSLQTTLDMCPKDECSKETYDYCTNPLKNLEVTPNNHSPEEACRVWWDSKACYAHFYDKCPVGGEIRNNIDGTWYHMESVMGYCKGHAMCSEEERKACTYDMEHEYDMKDKCNAAGRAKDCLKDVRRDCKDKFVMMMVDYDSMPRVNKVMEQCMYGHGDGWENGPHYGSAQSTKALPILALLLATVAKMVSRF